MSQKQKIFKPLGQYFLSGVLVIVPIIFTFVVLRFFFRGVDNLLSPLLTGILHKSIPGLGFLATLILIFIIGILARNVVGYRLFRLLDLLFIKTPLVRTIYGASKQLLEGIALPEKKAFQQVVLVQYPRLGIYNLGFVSNRLQSTIKNHPKDLIAVFIPTTPTPFTGFVSLFTNEEIIPLDVSIEEGIKFFVSGGIASPEKLSPRKDISSHDKTIS